MKPISRENMALLIKHFSKMFRQIQSTEQRNTVIANINEAMRDKFDDAKCNGYMFGMGTYDCHIVNNIFNGKMKVQYHKRWKPKYKPGVNRWEIEYSHEIDFDKFCYQYCNPDIIHIIERVLFQIL
jgi:hypothetical protein